MPLIAGKEIETDAEGFLKDAAEWNEDIAREIAAEIEIGPLTDRHWIVINFMREKFFKDGDGPTIRTLGKKSGVSTKELYQLFPKGPAKKAARIAGIPKPRGCI